jgi:hypothetical protein
MPVVAAGLVVDLLYFDKTQNHMGWQDMLEQKVSVYALK